VSTTTREVKEASGGYGKERCEGTGKGTTGGVCGLCASVPAGLLSGVGPAKSKEGARRYWGEAVALRVPSTRGSEGNDYNGVAIVRVRYEDREIVRKQ